MDTLLGKAAGARTWDNYHALIGAPDGSIHAMTISPEVMLEIDRSFAKPIYVPSFTVRLLNKPEPILVPEWRLPVDIDDMILGVLEKRPRVTARTSIPPLTYRVLTLQGYAIDRILSVYCAFDQVDRQWYVHR